MLCYLPIDIQHWIFSLVPFSTLEKHYRSGHLGPLLTPSFESYIFQYLHFGDPWRGNPKHLLHDVSVAELQKLARGEIKCHVRYLKLCRPLRKSCLERQDFEKFFEGNFDFLSTITSIEYEGDIDSYLTLNLSSLPSTKKICVNGFPFKLFEGHSPLEKVGLVPIPPYVESVFFEFYKENDLEFHPWPSLLRHLGLRFDYNMCDPIEYMGPDNLIALTTRGESNTHWTETSQRGNELENLSHALLPDFQSLREIILANETGKLCSFRHDQLSELKLSTSWAKAPGFLKTVPNLRKLTLDTYSITSLNMEFPKHLEVLEVPENNVQSLENVRFPPTLRELNLSRNKIDSLEGVRFPNLKILDISDLPINDNPSQMNLPETLTHFYARGIHLDWAAVRLPNLVALELCCLHVDHLKLPRTLQSLRLCIDPWNYCGQDLRLPPKLTNLTLRFGDDLGSECCSYWMEHMDLEIEEDEPLSGFTLSHLKIPKSVKYAELRSQDEDCFQDLILPDGLEELVSDFPIRNLPRNLMCLRLEKSNSKVVRLNLPKLIGLDKGSIESKIDLRGVPNLEFFRGYESGLCDTWKCPKLRVVG